MTVRDLVFGQLQDYGKKLQQLVPNVLVNVAVEALNLLPVLTEYIWVLALILRQELHDVVEFNVIPQPWENLNGSQRPVAIVNALFERCSVRLTHFLREGKEFASDRVLTIDFVLT
jgi:hypothetical protein